MSTREELTEKLVSHGLASARSSTSTSRLAGKIRRLADELYQLGRDEREQELALEQPHGMTRQEARRELARLSEEVTEAAGDWAVTGIRVDGVPVPLADDDSEPHADAAERLAGFGWTETGTPPPGQDGVL